jgi:hypothetical protein
MITPEISQMKALVLHAIVACLSGICMKFRKLKTGTSSLRIGKKLSH